MKNILNRKNIFSTQSILMLIIVVAVLVVINLISVNHFGRLDLTTDQEYSISDASKNIVKNLDDLLTIKVYFSSVLPPDLAQTEQYLKDILSEYQAYSKKIHIEFIDPAKDPKIKEEVQNLGIPEIEMQILQKDVFQVQKGYLGVALFYADKKEIIPVIQNTDNLEYDLTSAINRLTSQSLRSVAFLSGDEEHGLYSLPFDSGQQTATNDYSEIAKDLNKNYRVTTIDLTKDEKLDNIDTLIIAGPKKELSDKELYQIDQFIMKGGKAIFLIDKVMILPGLQAAPNKTNLEKLLSTYGIQLNEDLVIDSTDENVGFSSGQVQFLLPYPYWPKLIKNNFLKDHPVVAKLQSISLPWVSSLTPNPQPNIEIKTLATTTEQGATVKAPFDLNPQQNFNPTGLKKIPLILEAKGKFNSAFSDKPPNDLDTAGFIKEAEKESQIIVVANSNFINDNYASRFPENLVFFQNAVDYLTLDSNLIGIRSKTLTNRPLQKISEGTKTWIKVINIGLIPLIIIIIGVVRFYLRKRNK
ncbi:MAG: GldG family protein [Candidatus Parcubacteria bacterium]|nr:GldG family protein [Candidatus Parcubacteria bacterium]